MRLIKILCHLNIPPTARFMVYVRRPGVIALQNVSRPECWLTIKDDQTNGNVSSKNDIQWNLRHH